MARGRARRGPLLIAFAVTLCGSADHTLAQGAPAAPSPAAPPAPPPPLIASQPTSPLPFPPWLAERIRTVYTAPPACPSEAVFAGELRQRTRRPWIAAGRSSERTFRIAITSSEGMFRGRLVTETPGGSNRSDEIADDKCADVVSALAVKTALAIDAGPPRPLPPTFRLEPKNPLREDPRFMHPPAVLRLDEREPPWRITLGAQLTALGGVAPGVSTAVSLFADLSRIAEGEEAATVRISVMRAQSFLVFNQEIVTMELVASRLEGCPLHRRFGAFTFAPCFAVDTGVVEWEADPPSAVRQWLAVNVIGRAQVTLFGRLVLEGQVAAIIPLTRDKFGFGEDEVNGRAVHEVPVLTGSASGGVGVRFP